MFCSECGSEINDITVGCGKCGQKKEKEISSHKSVLHHKTVESYGVLLVLSLIIWGISFFVLIGISKTWELSEIYFEYFLYYAFGFITVGLVGLFGFFKFSTTRKHVKAEENAAARKASLQVLLSSIFIIIGSAGIVSGMLIMDAERDNLVRLVPKVKEKVIGMCENSLGDIFSNKSGFKSVRWKSFKSEGGTNVVQVEAFRAHPNESLLVQFKIENDTLELYYVKIFENGKGRSLSKFGIAEMLMKLDEKVSRGKE